MSKDTLAKRIIPCLDIKNGRVVKGVNFVGLQDAGNPIEVARRYNDEGADEITFLSRQNTNHPNLQKLEHFIHSTTLNSSTYYVLISQ